MTLETDLNNARKLIASARWTEARMTAFPHSYVVKKVYPDMVKFFKEIIAKYGYNYTATFLKGSPVFRQIDIDGYEYWHYTNILNRRPLKRPATPYNTGE